MGDFDATFVEAVKVQSWSLYSVGILFICTRTFARIHRLGLRQLQVDDYLMLLVGGLYTALIVTLNVICQGGGSNLYPPEMAGTFTEHQIEERIYGSKIVVVSEQAMLNVIYCIKTCMLIMYTRLTLGLTTQKIVRYLAIYVAIGWMATQIAFFTACRPFQGYWAMPPPNPQCTTLEHYAIVQGCFNISSDLLMLCIPIPLVLKVNMAWRQKAMLLFIFSMGGFVIVAALLTKVMNLTNVWDPSYMLWYIRESSVAVYVSNLPMIWPLLREWFPFLRNLHPTSNRQTGGSGGRPAYAAKGSRGGLGGGDSSGGSGSAGGSALRSADRGGGDVGLITIGGSGAARADRRGRRDSLDSAYDMELALKKDRVSPAGEGHGGGPSPSPRRIVDEEMGRIDGAAAHQQHSGPPSSSSSCSVSSSQQAARGQFTADASSSTEHIVPSAGQAAAPGTAATTTEVVALDRRAPLSGIHIQRTVEVRRADSNGDLEKGSVFDWERSGRATHLANINGHGYTR